MITELLFLMSYLVLLPIVFMYPFAGALAYEWLQYMPPYDVYNAYGLSNFSLIMGGLGLGLWMVKDKKLNPMPASLVAIFIVYILWNCLTQLTSVVGPASATLWDRAWKTLLFTFLLAFMARSRFRIEAFLWVVCLLIGNFVLSGAIKTVLSGGGGLTVVGTGSSFLGDSVNFAIVTSALIPFVRYLRNHAELVKRTKKMILGMDLFTVACIATVIGTQRRTGVVALGVLAAFYFVKSKKKMQYLAVLPVLIGIFFAIAPHGYFDRMNTIGTHDDASSNGRIELWKWGWQFALSHPITGGGYHSFVLHRYPDPQGTAFLEAHNILVETLADHGFIGLGLFLVLILAVTINCQMISSRARKLPELAWAVNLGAMLQLSLWTFLAGSMFLSDATYSWPYEIASLSLAARGIVERRLAQDKKSVFMPESFAMSRSAVKIAGSPVPAPAMAYGRQG